MGLYKRAMLCCSLHPFFLVTLCSYTRFGVCFVAPVKEIDVYLSLYLQTAAGDWRWTRTNQNRKECPLDRIGERERENIWSWRKVSSLTSALHLYLCVCVCVLSNTPYNMCLHVHVHVRTFVYCCTVCRRHVTLLVTGMYMYMYMYLCILYKLLCLVLVHINITCTCIM